MYVYDIALNAFTGWHYLITSTDLPNRYNDLVGNISKLAAEYIVAE